MPLPRKIHQLWVGPKDCPDKIKEFCEATRKMNLDWEYQFHGNEVLRRYGSDPYVRHLLNVSEKMAFVADRIRILLLRDEGGLYVDADAKPLQPLSREKIWDMPHVDFISGFRDPYRAGVALHRGISLIDNTFMASVPNGRMVNRLANLYSSRTPKRNGHDAGVEILANCHYDTVFLNFRYFYSMKATPESLFDHDSINLGSWVDKPHLQFAQ